MNKVLTICIALFFSLQSFSQQDSTTIEQYCAVVATPRLLSTKVTINIDYGESRSVWKDNRLKTEEGKVKKFNTVIDALNYMGNNGWQLVNAFPVSTGTNSFVYNYVFRKVFLREEGIEVE
ncbi:MAG: hypothetical protein IPH34_00660 [Chitinophagaceae bacterium]|nr:hypothetical protein [Chitinophagaceae bacterium]